MNLSFATDRSLLFLSRLPPRCFQGGPHARALLLSGGWLCCRVFFVCCQGVAFDFLVGVGSFGSPDRFPGGLRLGFPASAGWGWAFCSAFQFY